MEDLCGLIQTVALLKVKSVYYDQDVAYRKKLTMKFFLDPSILYTLLVLIPWAVAFIPKWLREDRHKYIYLSIVIQMAIYGFLLRVVSEEESWTFVISITLILVGFLSIGGYVQHWANEKYKSK